MRTASTALRCCRGIVVPLTGCGAAAYVAPLVSRRFTAERPSDDDVRKAYRTLGIGLSGPAATKDAIGTAAVKKRFHELAKQHHPDAAGKVGGHSSKNAATMSDVNAAYNTVQNYFKTGGDPSRLVARAGGAGAGAGGFNPYGGASAAGADPHSNRWAGYWGTGNPTEQSSFNQRSAQQQHTPYGGNPFQGGGGGRQAAYPGQGFPGFDGPGGMPFGAGPADMDPRFWEGYMGGFEGMSFDHSDMAGDFYYVDDDVDFDGGGGPGGTDAELREAWMRAKMHEAAEEEWFEGRMRRKQQQQQQQQQQQKKQQQQKHKKDSAPFEDPGPSLLTKAEQEALANMHRDGKSFNFIANALNRPVTDVVGEFNRQSTLGQFESKPRRDSSSSSSSSKNKKKTPNHGAQQHQQQQQQQQQQQPRNNRGGGDGSFAPRVDMTAEEFDEFMSMDHVDPSIADARIFVDGVEVTLEYEELDDFGKPVGGRGGPTPFYGSPLHGHRSASDPPRRGSSSASSSSSRGAGRGHRYADGTADEDDIYSRGSARRGGGGGHMPNYPRGGKSAQSWSGRGAGGARGGRGRGGKGRGRHDKGGGGRFDI